MISWHYLSSKLIPALAIVSFISSTRLPAQADEPDVKLQQRLKRFPQADANGDGVLTRSEADAFQKSRRTGKSDRTTTTDGQSIAPARTDVAYGPHARNRLDLWKASSTQPTPVLVFFHGGSFKGGDKSAARARPILGECLEAGISVVSANYRFSSDAPYPAPMLDGARVVEFVRSQADEWEIDPARIAVSGTSAGATLALWVALHDDLADPASPDAVARFSTRVTCASPHSGTAGLESDYFKQQAGVLKQGAALWQLFGASSQSEFDSPAKQQLAREASPLSLATRDDPPLFLTYQGDPAEAPFPAHAAQSNWIHHVCLGLPLKTRYDDLGLPCELYYRSQPPPNGAEIAFLKKHLFSRSNTNTSRP